MVSDSDSIPDTFEYYEAIALVISNLAFVPAIFAAAYKRQFRMLSFFTLTMAISTFYHFCMVDIACIAEVHPLAQWDFIFAMGGIPIILKYIIGLDNRRYRGAYLLLDEFYFWMFEAIIIIRVLIDREDFITFVWIASGALLLILIKTILVDKFKVYVDDYNWAALIVGSLIILIGLVLFFVSTLDTYWWTHAFWHVIVFIGIFFLIFGRRNNSIPVYEHKALPKK